MAVHLVTTSLPSGAAPGDCVVLLGSWCAPYSRSATGQDRPAVVPYHWDDRQKLAIDYEYLKSLHGRLLNGLAVSLGQLHGLRRNARYWRTVLDPWLFDYVAVMFDRWESIRAAHVHCPGFTTDDLGGAVGGAPRDWLGFIDDAIGDAWNHRVYLDILRTQYPAACTVRERRDEASVPTGPKTPRGQTRGVPARGAPIRAIGRAFSRVDRLLRERNDVFFHDTYFPRRTFVAINLRLGQWPGFSSCFDDAGESIASVAADFGAARAGLAAGIEPHSDFERWLCGRLGSDLPTHVVERFGALRAAALRVRARCRVIFSTTGQYADDVFKIWAAERVFDGCRLVLSEHGGSFPAPGELFDYDEEIADTKVTWFLPYHPKHVQLPATKLAGSIRPVEQPPAGPSREQCIVIAPDYPRYAYRAHFYPIAGQVETVHEMIVKLGLRVGPAVRSAFRVKPYPASHLYRDSARWFEEKLGSDAVIVDKSLQETFAAARIVVGAYPETTFSEAMAAGVPVILVYPPQYYERHRVAAPLIERLEAADIVFHDVDAAAAHLDRTWENPSAWWQRDDVVRARQLFQQQALGYDGDAVTPWVRFFRRMQSAEALVTA